MNIYALDNLLEDVDEDELEFGLPRATYLIRQDTSRRILVSASMENQGGIPA